jgi:hypothetical protein
MSTDSGEMDGLFKAGQVIGEFVACECCAIVGHIALYNDAVIATSKLESFLGAECFMGGEADLMLDMYRICIRLGTGLHHQSCRIQCKVV